MDIKKYKIKDEKNDHLTYKSGWNQITEETIEHFNEIKTPHIA